MAIVLTIGTFEIFHAGHAHLLRECEKLGEVYVGVNSDEFVKQYKGSLPLFNFKERRQLISHLGYNTWMNDSPGKELIEKVEPDYLVIGSDWARKDYYEQIGIDQGFLDENDIIMVYVPYTPGVSTTAIKERLNG